MVGLLVPSRTDTSENQTQMQMLKPLVTPLIRSKEYSAYECASIDIAAKIQKMVNFNTSNALLIFQKNP